MASFTEQASLLLDAKQPKSEIRALDRELKKLFKPRSVNMDVRGIDKAVASAKRLDRDLAALSNRRINLDVTGIPEVRQAQQALSDLRQMSRVAVRPDINVTGVGRVRSAVSALRDLNRLTSRRPAGATPLVGSRDLQTLKAIEREARSAAAAVALIGEGGPSAGLRAIAAMIKGMVGDARAANAAMSGFGRQGRTRQPQPQTPTGQANGLAQKPQGRMPVAADWLRGAFVNLTINGAQVFFRNAVVQGLEQARQRGAAASTTDVKQLNDLLNNVRAGRNEPVSTAQKQQMVSGFLPDTGGDVKAANALVERQIQAALRVAQGRGISFDDAMLIVGNDLVKAVGQTTDKLTDANGNITKRANDMFRAAEDALISNPDLTAATERAATANLKSTRTTVSPDEFFRIMAVAAEQGQRAGNEFYQFVQSLEGRQGKKQNAFLREQGLQDQKGEIVDRALLESDAQAWFVKNFLPRVDAAIDQEAKKKGRPLTAAEEDTVANKFAQQAFGRQTAGNAAIERRVSNEAIQRAIEQRDRARKSPEELAQLRANNPAAQLDLMVAKFNDAVGSVASGLGQLLTPAISGTANAFNSLANFVSPQGTPDPLRAAGVAAGGAAALGGGLFAGKKLLDFLNPLTGSATALNASAANLDAAAAALMRAAGVEGAGGMAGATGARGAGLNRLGLPPGTSIVTQAVTLIAPAAAIAGALGKLGPGAQALFNPTDAIARFFGAEGDMPVSTAIVNKVSEWLGPKTIGQQIAEAEKAKAEGRTIQVPTDKATSAQLMREFERQQTSKEIKIESATVEMGKMMELKRQDAARPPLGNAGISSLETNIGAAGTFEQMLTGMDQRAATISQAFGIGTTAAKGAIEGAGQTAGQAAGTAITTAGVSAGTAIQTGGQSAAAMIQAALQAGAGAVAGAISGALAAGVNVRVQTTMPNGPAPADTGATGGGL